MLVELKPHATHLMIPVLYSRHKPAWNSIALIGFYALALWLGVMVTPLLAEGTNAAPVSPAPEDFGHYVVDHQDDLSPYFDNHTSELASMVLPVIVGLLGKIVVLTLIVCWFVDVFLIRCFSAYFAPFYARLKRSMLYASIQAVINLVAAVLLILLVFAMFSSPNFLVVFVALILLLFLLVMGAQIWWVSYLYRMGVVPSAVYNLSLIAVHWVAILLVATPVVGHAPREWIGFMDQGLVPKMKTDIETSRQQLAEVTHKRDEIKAQVTDTQNRLNQAMMQQQQLQKLIETKKNSEVYLFSQIAKTRAKGDLTAARDQYNDFIAKFPSGGLVDTAKAELATINADIATQDAQKKKNEADAAAAAAKARADLLARANQGKVTLSEMREVLIGKTTAQVSDLLGPPAAIASNRWGYDKQMIENPLTGEKYGLAVKFDQGLVQGVDYYYGNR